MKNKSLCANCTKQDPENKWLPTSINIWREIILSKVYDYKKDDSDPKYRSN